MKKQPCTHSNPYTQTRTHTCCIQHTNTRLVGSRSTTSPSCAPCISSRPRAPPRSRTSPSGRQPSRIGLYVPCARDTSTCIDIDMLHRHMHVLHKLTRVRVHVGTRVHARVSAQGKCLVMNPEARTRSERLLTHPFLKKVTRIFVRCWFFCLSH